VEKGVKIDKDKSVEVSFL